MSAAAATKELLLVKRQLEVERERHKESEAKERDAEEIHARLMEQMEKNYKVAQRVHAEKAKREESDHFLKGIREQMRSATARAVKVASQLEKEKAENAKLRNELARMRSRMIREKSSSKVGVAIDSDYEMEGYESYPEMNNGEDASEDYSIDDFERISAGEDREEDERTIIKDMDDRQQDIANKNETDSDPVPRKKKKGRKIKRKKRRPKSVGRPDRKTGSANQSSRIRPRTAIMKPKNIDEKLRLAKSHNADLFRRLADAKRQVRAARAESDSKSEQLHALSNHLEKMMALLRAEAAAKSSAEEALRSTEDELEKVKLGKTAIARELANVRLSEKDEMKRDSMLSKQLELMDEKYATLLRTNNFNRAKEAREGKELRAKMHSMAESMHQMMRECEDARIASRNTIYAFSCLVSGLGMFDRTPFKIAVSESSLEGKEKDDDLVVLALQDCNLGDEGALSVATALDVFTSREAKKQSAVKNAVVNPKHKALLQSELKGLKDKIVSPSSSTESPDFNRELSFKPSTSDLISLRRPPVHISIDLSYNNITDSNGSAVVRSLCRSIVATHSITEINLRGNRIGAEGLKMILDALQYNDGVRAVDLSGNLIGEADLLEYINSTKHVVGLPSLRMITGDGDENRKRVETHESLVALDRQSRLKRHGVKDVREKEKQSSRPASAPLRRKHTNMTTVPHSSKVSHSSESTVMIDFPPKTSAVNAVQRVILDSITRVEAHNPFRRTSEAGSRGRQSLQDGDRKARPASSRRAPDSARSNGSTKSVALEAQAGKSKKLVGASTTSQSKSSTIRSRLRLPPKRAASAALLRTPAGMTPAERKSKYHEEEKKMKQAREEAMMLLEAAAVDAHMSKAERKRDSGAKDVLNVDITIHPRFGGTYAHEVFWPAFASARNGDYTGLSEWLGKGMKVEAREPSTGQSLLMASAISSSEISMRMLIRKGARVNGQCNKGWTALHHCIASGTSHLYMADQLISRGAKTEVRDLLGVTPLQLAVEQGSPDAICRLIEAGADITTTDNEGRTVLHRCAARKYKIFNCKSLSPLLNDFR